MCNEQIEHKHLLRWAHQPLPVFLVSTAGPCTNSRRFFVLEIDAFLKNNPMVLAQSVGQKIFSVRTHYTNDVAAEIRRRTETFYRQTKLSIDNEDPTEIASHHIEFLNESEKSYSKCTDHYWKAIWKSSARPANFSALVDYIVHRARTKISSAPSPSMLTCFLYRSSQALQTNQWAARITWREKDHSQALEAWAEHDKIEIDKGNNEAIQRWIEEKTVSAEAFIMHLIAIADRTEEIARQILLDTSRGNPWPEKRIGDFRKLQRDWDAGHFPPPNLYVAGQFLTAFISTLETHRWETCDKIDAPSTRVQRWQQQELDALKGYLGATKLLIDVVTRM